MVERAGEHMQALVNARSKLMPWRFRRRIPGRFSRSQFAGKCWIARSWSVMKRITFLPAMLREGPPGGSHRDASSRSEQRSGGGRCARGEQLLACQSFGHRVLLLKATMASLPDAVA